MRRVDGQRIHDSVRMRAQQLQHVTGVLSAQQAAAAAAERQLLGGPTARLVVGGSTARLVVGGPTARWTCSPAAGLVLEPFLKVPSRARAVQLGGDRCGLRYHDRGQRAGWPLLTFGPRFR
jgi:hypothetical protein